MPAESKKPTSKGKALIDVLHVKDGDCGTKPGEICPKCGVLRGHPCPLCGGESFHQSFCPDVLA